jgi:hypothetical protein
MRGDQLNIGKRSASIESKGDARGAHLLGSLAMTALGMATMRAMSGA